ncbi:MAG: alpha/beta hydrolase [Chitinophagaceae bacterium]|nr:alpha/beta hydrolase [Chitinophagaceae bacterium]MCZ2396378.1 alpha/beta hydrolase [Chitinophagales bacterium]
MRQIRFQNKIIRYQTYGQGSPVVLLHGFGESGAVWDRQVRELGPHFCLIVPDLPGSGASEPLDNDFSLDDFADSVKAITDKELPGQKFHLFGHSMGGYTTMAFAEKYEEQLLSFGLVHSSAYPDTDSKKEARLKGVEFIRKNGGQAFLKTITPGLFTELSQKQHPEYISELLSLTSHIADDTLIACYHAMMNRPDRSEVLKSTTVPVLFIIGKFDQVVPLELSLKQAALPALSSVHILQNTAHMGMWEEEELTNQYILNFLNDSFN